MRELYADTTVAMIGNPASDNGKGAKIMEQVFDLLSSEGVRHGFGVIDLTGDSFQDSLHNARSQRSLYDYLVVVGGDAMVALGANAVGCSKTPLGIVAVGSGNDFARGMKLPINRVQTAVDGIVGAIVRDAHIDVDMGRIVSLPGGQAVDNSTGDEFAEPTEIDCFYGGMLSCGLDAGVNHRANHSRLPGGSLRYFAGVITELLHLKKYGYHIKSTLADGTVEEKDIISPMLTVANSRHIGGGLEVSPYSRFNDGLLDLIWIDHMPNIGEIVDAVSRAYTGGLLGSKVFGWKRVREVEISHAADGEELPILMADGEYVGHPPVKVTAQDRALRVLVPPAVALDHGAGESDHIAMRIRRDGRDPLTGEFVR